MANNNTMTPKQKRNFIIGFVIFMIVCTTGFFVASDAIDSNAQERNDLTSSLPRSVMEIFDVKNHYSGYDTADEFASQINFKRYIYLADIPVATGDTVVFTHSYDKSVNKKLGSDAYYGSSDLDGIIFTNRSSVTVGYYHADGLFGKGDSKSADSPAFQNYSVVNYMAMPERIVIRRDTVWGGEPPRSIKMTERAGVGGAVTDADIVKVIKKALGE